MIPFFDVALEAFGAKRLIFGSNWPVSEATGGYDRWIRTARDWASRLSADEQRFLFGATAQSVYRPERRT
jgi:L-fuconolactonase